MKIKQFSHNDLDGVGSIIVGKQAFGDSLSYECCSYDNIDEKVARFILSDEFKETDVVFITDISIKEPALIKLIERDASDKLMIIDHHASAEHLNRYKWAQVSEIEKVTDMYGNETKTLDGEDTRLSSGTTAFYNYLIKNNLLTPTEELYDFVEQVRSWDTWDWTRSNPQNILAKQLNSLHVLIGHYKFINRFSQNPEVTFNGTERTLLEVEERRIESTIYQKKRDVIKMDVNLESGRYKIGVVFADNYHSELGNEIANDNPDIDFVLLVNGGTRLSFRTVKEDIDLSVIAKEFGGGGHPMAAGAVLTDVTRLELIKTIFNTSLNQE